MRLGARPRSSGLVTLRSRRARENSRIDGIKILRLGVALVIVAGLDAAAPAQPAPTNERLTSAQAPSTDHAVGFYDPRLRRVVVVGGTGRSEGRPIATRCGVGVGRAGSR